jgi:hypothetical protein
MRQLLIATALLVGLAGTANAQFPIPGAPAWGPGYRPQLSPYLNLLRSGNSSAAAAANLYLGTYPEQQRRINAVNFTNAITDLQRRTAPGQEDYPDPPPVRSGTTPFLGNTGGYFNNSMGFYPPIGGRPSNLVGAPIRGRTGGRR